MSQFTQLSSEAEISLAQDAYKSLAAQVDCDLEVQLLGIHDKSGKEKTVALPGTAMSLLLEVLTQMGKGNNVTIAATQAYITTQQAADILSMSRPTLIKLLEVGELPYHRSGNRRKIALNDVLMYQKLSYANPIT